MKPKRIILIRHGESEGNVNKRIYNQKPDFSLLLTDKGKQQAKAAGTLVKETLGDEKIKFYVSPLFRTRQTFKHICESFPDTQYQWQEEPRLREQEWGHLRSMEECIEIEKQRDNYGTFYFRIPDGESAADVYDRVSDFFNTLYRDFEKKDYPPNAVMVTHGMSIRLFLMRWFHFTVEEFELIANPHNCAMIVMELQDSGKYLLAAPLNKHRVAHQWRLEE
jgi:broad specificity phosphatase PhoE